MRSRHDYSLNNARVMLKQQNMKLKWSPRITSAVVTIHMVTSDDNHVQYQSTMYCDMYCFVAHQRNRFDLNTIYDMKIGGGGVIITCSMRLT